ncbi:Glu/Leu/Phe/Val family dehydrogenase [Streptomyces kanamyceticus]|uniref:Valine dehydrogenase n=1 Tax=Streptomyces kanamyceticus TaxID=1967 RepID=A0A5J6G4G6_STRKN|nr:Glu/Leu/Phe/Val dehydrogenase dimerization domain-containing protein [Streptomyces kanamyceticus]QEU89797.1 Glu/Leu/Phe/Val dehydrogenase [Streptomyces kanamyceticus]
MTRSDHLLSTRESARPDDAAEPGELNAIDLVGGVFAEGTGGVRDVPHEKVLLCQDEATGLKAIVSLHSTALGPALGGTRFRHYGTAADAVLDSLNLARGMSYKNALAGLPYGGGKAVIIGDPSVRKTRGLLRAYGRFVESLGGRYVTSCDMGTNSADMDIVGEVTCHVVGCSVKHGGGGDPSALTAYGVLQGMRACAAVRWGVPVLRGRRVGVSGVGKVGQHLVDLLVYEGAIVVAADPRPSALARTRARHPEVSTTTPPALLHAELDIFAPCALGGVLDQVAVNRLRTDIICGAANNQLGYGGAEERLRRRDIVYAPDYVVNAGGVIHMAQEHAGTSGEFCAVHARKQVMGIYDTTLSILTKAESTGATPCAVADELAEQRMASASHASAGPRVADAADEPAGPRTAAAPDDASRMPATDQRNR